MTDSDILQATIHTSELGIQYLYTTKVAHTCSKTMGLIVLTTISANMYIRI